MYLFPGKKIFREYQPSQSCKSSPDQYYKWVPVNQWKMVSDNQNVLFLFFVFSHSLNIPGIFYKASDVNLFSQYLLHNYN